ncbi:hypothetical protein [Pimelobacter simplex]|uniref:hypothetical protein n=1 Tax=Nocardioides simplex TaxID=2045 RepID=UPI00193320C3|nr:hypothetical protein [Pimelobacter simplex]
MTPFQQFRLWARRAPVLERLATAAVGIVLLGVLAWAVVPLATTGASSEAPASSGLSFADLDGGSQAPPAVAPPQTAPNPCAPPPADAQGVTDDSIDVGVALVDLGGAAGNETFGLASVPDQKAAYSAVAADINKAGGAACRKIVLHFYNANASSPDLMHQTCLAILQDKPFAVLDVGGFQSQVDCVTDAKVPFFTARLSLADASSKYPYLFAQQADEVSLHNSVYALKSLGYFDGDPKVGVVYRDCQAAVVEDYFGWLSDIGIAEREVVKYNFGCPNGFAAPEALQQAVLKLKKEDVTRVLPIGMAADFANLTKSAQEQQFKPKYGVSGADGILDVTYGLLGPDFENLEGSIGISATAFGEERSDVEPATGTKACNALMTGVGLPAVYDQKAGLGGHACTQLWELQAMLNNVTEVSTTALAEGLSKAGPLPHSYPAGPTANTDPRITFGGQYWRAMEFKGDCDCWDLLDETFKPGFP